jgi:hypothetical protein
MRFTAEPLSSMSGYYSIPAGKALKRRPLREPRTPVSRWSIGIYAGGSPFRLSPPPGLRNPVLTRREVTDVDAGFVADPFLVRRGADWWMFFEVKNRQSGLGEIGLAQSADGLRWRYRRIVLREPFHLSYPYVFTWRGSWYMVPETLSPGAVRLYRARSFPLEWGLAGELVAGSLADPSLFRHAGAWWLLACATPSQHDTLRLFGASYLRGPWREHPASPLVTGDRRRARPAGRVVRWRGRPVRFAQDCHPRYGAGVRAFAITELSAARYREEEMPESPVLAAGERGWNARGMHHVDALRIGRGRWLAAVDGQGP